MDGDVVIVVVVWGAVDVDDAVHEVEDPVLGEAGFGIQTTLESQVTLARRVGDLDDEVDGSGHQVRTMLRPFVDRHVWFWLRLVGREYWAVALDREVVWKR